MQLPRSLFKPWLGRATPASLAMVAALVLGGCGGGSDSGTASGGSSAEAPTTPATTTPAYPVVAPAGSYVLQGVAAAGAPVMGAIVRAIDGYGLPVGFVDSTGRTLDFLRTSTADGSFRALVASPSPALPLLIQVSGADASGTPITLHSALTDADAPHVANVTPASDAIVAQVLGAPPAAVFALGVGASATMPLLVSSTAVATASDQVKSILKTALSDLKVDSATLDLMGNPAFGSDKTGLDLIFEGLRFVHARDTTGRDQLQISNKFLAPGVVEVRVDLASARAELLKGSAGTVTKALVSTLKAATSAQKASLLNAGTLDELPAALNRLISEGASANTFRTSAMLASHGVQDGRPQAEVASQLASFAGANLQLSRMQIMGCVDDPIPTKGCTHFAVSAFVTDRAGNVVDSFNDTAVYKSTTTPTWVLSGNDRRSEVFVRPAAQASFDAANQYVAASLVPGVQLAVRGNAVGNFGQFVFAADRATVRVPSGFSVSLRNCGLREMCIANSATAIPTPTGELRDTLIQRPAPGWIGSTDGARGARYQATVTISGTSTETINAYLPAEVDTEPAIGRFPVPDQPWPVSSASGSVLSFTWTNWAARNPDQRVLRIRTITPTGFGTVQVIDQDIDNPLARGHVITVPTRPTGSGWQLMMIAEDAQGRRFHSLFSLAP